MIINVLVERIKISLVYFFTPETANRKTAHYIFNKLDPFGYYPNVSRKPVVSRYTFSSFLFRVQLIIGQ